MVWSSSFFFHGHSWTLKEKADRVIDLYLLAREHSVCAAPNAVCNCLSDRFYWQTSIWHNLISQSEWCASHLYMWNWFWGIWTWKKKDVGGQKKPERASLLLHATSRGVLWLDAAKCESRSETDGSNIIFSGAAIQPKHFQMPSGILEWINAMNLQLR